MNNFGILYNYELKKILRRRLVLITMLVCVLVIAVSALSDVEGVYYVDGEAVDTHYHMFQTDREYMKALSGRKINQELIGETIAGYRHISFIVGRYTLTEKYQLYARPYSAIYNIIRQFTGMDNISDIIYNWEATEEALYAARENSLESLWKQSLLSDKEKEFWREKETQIKQPFTYFYHDGYSFLLNNLILVGLLALLFAAICLSSVFTEEHTKRTDQIILSSAKGKNTVYLAKILAGTSVAAAGALLMSCLTAGAAMAIYGADGFQTAMQVQIAFGLFSYPMTVGQACLIAYASLMIASVLMGVSVMVLSEIVHSNIATLAISSGMIIAGMLFRVPVQYRLLSLIWDCLPIRFLTMSNVFSLRLVHVWGHCFTVWQVVPVIYMICSALIAAAGIRVYKKYQVSGR